MGARRGGLCRPHVARWLAGWLARRLAPPPPGSFDPHFIRASRPRIMSTEIRARIFRVLFLALTQTTRVGRSELQKFLCCWERAEGTTVACSCACPCSAPGTPPGSPRAAQGTLHLPTSRSWGSPRGGGGSRIPSPCPFLQISDSSVGTGQAAAHAAHLFPLRMPPEDGPRPPLAVTAWCLPQRRARKR